MKIIAISSRHSDKNAIALVTEPPLTPLIFAEAERRTRTPALQALSLQMDSGCLIIHSDRFNPELRTVLEKFLTEAEDVASGVTALRQSEIEQSEKDLALESAAAGFGIPIV
jgi:hypothetical protein